MNSHLIPYTQINQFSSLILDYLQEKDEVREFYKYPPAIGSFTKVIQDKLGENVNREVLVNCLLRQYQHIPDHQRVVANIQSLQAKNTFAVTTGHQLCIFTGPLYFISKIITTINLAKKIERANPDYKVVPVFWMASEDHDLAEVNHVYVFGKKLEWGIESSGAVGVLNPQSLAPVIDELQKILGEGEQSAQLIALFRKAYLEHHTLADATRFLVHELFKEEGLVIIDGHDPDLKKLFIPVIKEDILSQKSFHLVSETAGRISKNYSVQVNPREVNFFYLDQNLRERMVRKSGEQGADDEFEVLNSGIRFSKDELIKAVENSPEKFSPNVVTRPLYQDKLLPNLAYVGGPAEVAYWLELKSTFEYYKINFPVVVLRNHTLIIDEAARKRMEKFGLTNEDIFKPVDVLTNRYISQHTEKSPSLEKQVQELTVLFEEILQQALKVDPSLKDTVLAEKTKQLNTLKSLEHKLIRAEKKKHEIEVSQIRHFKEKLFPDGVLPERKENFVSYYSRLPLFLETVLRQIDPLNQSLTVFF